MCDIVHNYIGSHSEVVLCQFPVLVGRRKFHIHVRCAMSLGSMHSGWMTIASSGRGKLFVAVLDRNRMLHDCVFCHIFQVHHRVHCGTKIRGWGSYICAS